jgi:hypothetical protein
MYGSLHCRWPPLLLYSASVSTTVPTIPVCVCVCVCDCVCVCGTGFKSWYKNSTRSKGPIVGVAEGVKQLLVLALRDIETVDQLDVRC